MGDSQDQEPAKGLGWFYGRWRKSFERIDKEAVRAGVQKLAERYPEESPVKLAKRVVQQTAKHCAAVGVATATPALIPGIGTAVSVVSIVPEEIYLIRKQCEMVLEVAAIFGFDPADNQRLYEIIILSGSPSKSVEALMVAKGDLRRMAAKAAAQLGTKTTEKTLVGVKTASRGVVRRLPALGFMAGGAINYASFKMLGNKAIRYYARAGKKSARDKQENTKVTKPQNEEALKN